MGTRDQDPAVKTPVGPMPHGPCSPDGAIAACYPGPLATESIGECHDGVATCTGGQWGECEGYQLPAAEECGDGLDNSCDGLKDEGCGCEPGAEQACYTGPAPTKGLGACHDGVQSCVAGSWATTCTGQVTPVPESCNGQDDDCNGLLDEGCACTDGATQGCYGGPAETLDVGVCRMGTVTCVGGIWPPSCAGQVLPSSEKCNGKDDDCDGLSDEGLPEPGSPCGTGQPGICSQGSWQCTGSTVWCEPDAQPKAESCNGEDDDCNGKVDDAAAGTGGSCTTGQLGPCAAGTLACQGGSIVCVGNVGPKTESCNGEDDDCDGSCDESAGCRVGVHRSWNPNASVHFYTTDLGEASCCGFQLEFVDYYYLATAPGASLVPYYRCVAPGLQHLYTTSANCEGTSMEGTIGYIATAPVCGAVPLYRLAHANNGDHFYTTSTAEKSEAVGQGYVEEGVSGYVWLEP
jgi:hypothetical protein